jgi:uncharacterized protein (TIGR03435 family)
MTSSLAARPGVTPALLLAALALAITPSPLYAQSPAASATPAVKCLAYDVVSIKQNKSDDHSTSVSTNNNYFSATNISLKKLIEFAYDIREDMISGISGPVESARFDVEAKVLGPDSGPPPKLTDKQLQAMLIPLLSDRFHIQSHTQMKTLPVYELQIAKGGPKIKSTACDPKTAA